MLVSRRLLCCFSSTGWQEAVEEAQPRAEVESIKPGLHQNGLVGCFSCLIKRVKPIGSSTFEMI